MKTSLFTFCLPLILLIVSCKESTPPDSSHQNSDKAIILDILSAQEKSWNEGDLDAFMNGYWKSDSLIFMGASGINYGYHKTLEGYKKRYPTNKEMGTLSFTVIDFYKLSEGAWLITGKFHLAREIGDASGFFSLVWKKINGEWVIIADHTS
ncbi:MAG: nuclear transport factor 2 family protein [Cyclobacteriaceae bacterium]|nr:nuclear transport factor 2 family protein [Cyclobacteriaceae bacterium]